MPQGPIAEDLKALRQSKAGRKVSAGTDPNQKPSMAPVGDDGSSVDDLLDFVKGGGKGLAKTVFGGGDLIRRATGMDQVIDDPEVQAITVPSNNAQEWGQDIEQLLEFFVPAGGAKKLAAKGLAKLAPSTLPVRGALGRMQAAPKINKAIASGMTKLAPSVGEGVSATGVSAMQGNEHPEQAGMFAAAAPLAGKVGGKVAGSLLGSDFGQHLLPILAAAPVMAAMPTLPGLGISAALWQLIKRPASKLARHPEVGKIARKTLETAGPIVGKMGAAAIDSPRVPRRKLEDRTYTGRQQ